MSRVWKSKQELCELAVRLRHTDGAGPQSVSLQVKSRHARAFAWFDVLDDVIHLWVEEARVAALKPAEPITWDGEDSTEQRIRDLLMETSFDAGSDRGEGDPPDDAPLRIWAGGESHEPVDVLTPGDSVTVFGRWPFVIRKAVKP